MAASVSIRVGDRFPSFNQLEKKIDAWKKQEFVELWRRNSRKIASATFRKGEPIQPELVYYELKYCCINGGKGFKPKGVGIRKGSTFRMGCPVHIALRATRDGKSLEVKSTSFSHNHHVSKESFDHLPSQRKLPEEVKEKARRLLKLCTDKKQVSHEIGVEANTVILLKDLSNIANQDKKKKNKSNLENTAFLLREKYGARVQLMVDDKDQVQGLFFQDEPMERCFSAFPEIVYIDATYKQLEQKYSVFVFAVEDSNGQTEVAGVSVLGSETAENLTLMATTFKSLNPNWKKMRVLMADKDIKVRHELKACFPQARLLTCLFHVLRSFRREVTKEKLGIMAAERTMALEIMEKLANAPSVKEYKKLHDYLKSTCPASVTSYFEEHWHSISSEWCLGLKLKTGNFLSKTNSRLESINQKLKSVVGRRSNIEDFVDNLFIILHALRGEIKHKALVMMQKIPADNFENDSPESSFSALLTQFAKLQVLKQMALAEDVIIIVTKDKFSAASPEGEVNFSSVCCNCCFRSSLLLPCQHIFACRKLLNRPLYDDSLCDKRWRSDYYRKALQATTFETRPTDITARHISNRKNTMSQHEKFKKFSYAVSKMSALTSEVDQRTFDLRYKFIQDIIAYWEAGEEVTLLKKEDIRPKDDLSSKKTSITDTVYGSDEQREVDSNGDLSVGAPKKLKILDIDHPLHETHVEQFLTHGTLYQPLENEVEHPGIIIQNLPDDHPKTVENLILDPMLVEENIEVITTELNDSTDNENLDEYPIQPKKPRGRPKGRTNANGPSKLPKKRKHLQCTSIPFNKKSLKQQEKIMLSWFVDIDKMEGTSNGDLLDEDALKSPDKVCNSALPSKNINVECLRYYFTEEGWKELKSIAHIKERYNLVKCNDCANDLSAKDTIICDACLEHYHVNCVGLNRRSKSKVWFCQNCRT